MTVAPPGEASLVDHIWKRSLSKLALAKACFNMYQISSATKADIQYHMPNAWPSPLKYKIMVQTFCKSPCIGGTGDQT